MRSSQRNWQLAHPEVVRAYEVFKAALASGRIVRPVACSRCEVECVPHGHHADYSKPLDVTWLCRKCHVRAHTPTPKIAHSVAFPVSLWASVKAVAEEDGVSINEAVTKLIDAGMKKFERRFAAAA